MSGANIGTAYMTVSPKFDGLGSAVESAFSKVDGSSAGARVGDSFSSGVGKGLASSGAIIGAFSAVTSKAMDIISSSIGGAIERFDTLKIYPRVMQTLGYSAEDAQSSIEKMADHLTGLPTALNDMSSTVQGIAAITGNLTEATDAGLALNDMLLASGSNTALVQSAMEQFRQMLAKGKPDMQDWKSLTMAMPAQLTQLAKSLLGPTANMNDLYLAIGGGKSDATISLDQLMAKMVELDTTSSTGFTSFAEQAKSATGGVQSSLSNAETAIKRGLTDIMDSIGQTNISGAIKGVGGAFETALKKIGDGVTAVKPYVSDFIGVVKDVAPTVLPAVVALTGLWGAGKAFGGIASTVVNAAGAMSGFGTSTSSVGELLLNLAAKAEKAGGAGSRLSGVLLNMASALSGPVVLGISVAVAALAIIGTKIYENWKKQKDYEDSVKSLSSAISDSSTVLSASGAAYGDMGSKAEKAHFSLDDLTKSTQSVADKIKSTNETASTNIGLLVSARDVIDQYANKTGLTTTQQGELRNAIETVNDQCGTQYQVTDAVNGVLADQDGVIQDTTGALDALIEKKLESLRVDALTQDYKDTYQGYLDSVKQQAAAYDDMLDAEKAYVDGMAELNRELEAGVFANDPTGYSIQSAELEKKKKDAEDAYATASDNVNTLSGDLDNLTDQIGSVTDAADGTNGVLQDLSSTSLASLNAGLTQSHGNFDDFRSQLASTGIDSKTLAGLSDEALMQMGASYGDTVGSIIASLAGLGIEGFDPAVAKAKSSTSQMATSIQALADGGKIDLDGLGISSGDFAQKLTDAGVTTQAQTAMQNGMFDSMLAQCGGDIDALIADLQRYNDFKIEPKSLSINTYGISDLEYAETLLAQWDAHPVESYTKDRYLNLYVNRLEGNAAGGIRPNAAGGYRFHGDGAIATSAVPLDIVGEAGAEAIVPLTNRKYAAPFARTIAEESGMDDVASQLAALRSELGGIIAAYAPRTVIDNDAGRMIVDGGLQAMRREAMMNCG